MEQAVSYTGGPTQVDVIGEREIWEALKSLDDAVEKLGMTQERLQKRLEPVMGREKISEANKDAPTISYGSAIAENIRESQATMRGIIRRLNDLEERVQV